MVYRALAGAGFSRLALAGDSMTARAMHDPQA